MSTDIVDGNDNVVATFPDESDEGPWQPSATPDPGPPWVLVIQLPDEQVIPGVVNIRKRR